MTLLKYWDSANSLWEPFTNDIPAPTASITVKGTVTGTVNGVNAVFTTTVPYVAGTLQVYVNGLAQSGFVTETTPTTGVFTLSVAPLTGDNIRVYFHVAGTGVGNANSIGNVTLPGLLEALYPIGATFISGSGTLPALIAGIGTWVRLNGRVIVGLDPAQAEFDTIDEIGGTKTHTLTVNEMPSHSHGQKVIANAGNPVDTRRDFESDINGNEFDQGVQTYSTGGGAAHNNIQPYKVKFMWERVN